MQDNVSSSSQKVTGADVGPNGAVLQFDNGISVCFSSEFLWQNREMGGNVILLEPTSDG